MDYYEIPWNHREKEYIKNIYLHFSVWGYATSIKKKRILGVSYIFPRGANKLVCIFIDIDHVMRILAVFL